MSTSFACIALSRIDKSLAMGLLFKKLILIPEKAEGLIREANKQINNSKSNWLVNTCRSLTNPLHRTVVLFVFVKLRPFTVVHNYFSNL